VLNLLLLLGAQLPTATNRAPAALDLDRAPAAPTKSLVRLNHGMGGHFALLRDLAYRYSSLAQLDGPATALVQYCICKPRESILSMSIKSAEYLQMLHIIWAGSVRACLRSSSEQEDEEGEVNELQAGIQFAFAVLPQSSALFQPPEGKRPLAPKSSEG